MRKSIPSILLLALAVASLANARSARADTCNGLSANLVANCSFETGTFASWSGTSTTDGTGIVDNGDSLAIGITPFSGTYEADLGSSGIDDTLTQSLATIPGATYLIEFALLNDTGIFLNYSNDFTATFGGTTIFTETNAPAGPYRLYTAKAQATASSTPITFTSQNGVGSFELDSVSVASTPEPSSLFLLGTGLIGVFAIARRRFVL